MTDRFSADFLAWWHARFCTDGDYNKPSDVAQLAWDAAKPEWQPIETAPKDRGLRMLGLLPGGRVVTITPSYWVDFGFMGYVEVERGSLVGCEPTHWMPLPPLG